MTQPGHTMSRSSSYRRLEQHHPAKLRLLRPLTSVYELGRLLCFQRPRGRVPGLWGGLVGGVHWKPGNLCSLGLYRRGSLSQLERQTLATFDAPQAPSHLVIVWESGSHTCICRAGVCLNPCLPHGYTLPPPHVGLS